MIRLWKQLSAMGLAAMTTGAALAGPQDYVGQVSMVPQTWCPRGSMPLDGRQLAITSYVALFVQFECAYSAPDCHVHGVFNLPDMRGRTPVGVGTGGHLDPQALGQKGGAQTMTLNGDYVPQHDHLVYFSALDPSQNDPRDHAIPTMPGGNAYDSGATARSQLNSTAVSPVGRTLPFTLYQYSQPLSFCIAATGTSPLGDAGEEEAAQ